MDKDKIAEASDKLVLHTLREELDEAERKAWDSLAIYEFQMFGYWAGIWVHLNRISGERRPNPWSELVKAARYIQSLGL